MRIGLFCWKNETYDFHFFLDITFLSLCAGAKGTWHHSKRKEWRRLVMFVQLDSLTWKIVRDIQCVSALILFIITRHNPYLLLSFTPICTVDEPIIGTSWPFATCVENPEKKLQMKINIKNIKNVMSVVMLCEWD